MTRGQNYIYYEAKTDALGSFAISATPSPSSNKINDTLITTETPIQKVKGPQKIEEPKFPLWEYVVIGLMLIGILTYIIIFKKKK